MIGSVLAWHLNHQLARNDLILVDHLQHDAQWQNLVHRDYSQYLDKSQLFAWLAEHPPVSAIVHLGAISSTTERDFNKLVTDNIHYSQQLWSWCTLHQVPFFYASSAATYGNGELGYQDESICHLRPLNAYGYSKQFFDQWVQKQGQTTPPVWAGFKFFNVYGPNEYHKGRMASVAFHTFAQFQQTGTMQLFKSNKTGIEDGMQLRDFVYVKDAARVIAHFLTASLDDRSVPPAQNNGIYNIGTGIARSFKALATQVMASMGREPNITYIDMPTDLQGKYQYFTQASVTKLRQAGYTAAFTSLEAGIDDYVQNYLQQDDPYC